MQKINGILKDMVQDMQQSVSAQIADGMNRIAGAAKRLGARVGRVEEKISELGPVVEGLVEKLDYKTRELYELMEEDMAPKVVSLTRELQKLRESRAPPPQMTPPRIQFGSRSSLSPSDVALDGSRYF